MNVFRLDIFVFSDMKVICGVTIVLWALLQHFSVYGL